MEKIIALRITLQGDREAVEAAKRINNELRETGKLIDATARKKLALARQDVSAKTADRRANSPAAPQASAAGLRKQILEAKELDQEYQQLVTTAGRLKAQQSEVNREIRDQARAFDQSKAAAGSYRQLNSELVSLRDTFRQLGTAEQEGIAGKDTLRRIQRLDRELKDLDGKMGIYTRNVGNYGSAFNKIGDVVGRFLAIGGISLGADEIIQEAALISDSIAGVEKVAGLTTEQVRKLSDELRLRDTRTSLNDQLAIAEIGGRSGINADNLGIEEAQRQLVEFTDAIDTANLALGDQFNDSAEEVASQLSGLRNVLYDFRPNGDADIGGDLLRIGNALNYLETQGNSTAPVIADFVNRVGGIAVPFGASTESIFALSATLDELEVTAERGATAVSNTLGKLAEAPEKFAKVVVDAGLAESTDQFVQLVNDDIISAFTLVAGAVEKNSAGATDYAAQLKELGITGSGAREVFAKLGGATDRYTELLGKSAEALSNSNSLTEEANKKNNTLGADLDKLRNKLLNTFNSGEVQDGLRVIVQGVTQLIAYVIEATKFIAENRVEVGLLASAFLVFEGALKAQAVAARSSALATALLTKVANANPFVKVASVVLLLAAGLATLYRRNVEVRKAVDGLIDSFLEAYNSSLLLKAGLGPLGLILKVIGDVIREGPGAFARYLDSAKTFAANVPVYIDLVKLKFREFGLSVQDALNFGIGEEKIKARLDAVRTEIENQQGTISANNEAYRQREIARQKQSIADAADARRTAAAEELSEANRLAAEKLEVENKARAESAVRTGGAELERVRQKVIAGQALTAAEKAIYDALSETQRAALDKEAELRRASIAKAKEVSEKAAAEAKRRAEQELQDRIAAAQKIADLENSLITNRFDRQEAEVTTTATRDIAGLVGDLEQIEQQTRLIEEARDRQLAAIGQARRDAHREALQAVREYADQLEDLQTTNAQGEAEGELKALKTALDTQQKAISRQEAQQRSMTLQRYRSGEINLKEYYDKLQEIRQAGESQQFEIVERRASEEVLAIAQVTEAKLAAADAEYERLKEQRAEQEQKRKQEVDRLQEDGDITEEEATTGKEEAEALRREQGIEDLRRHEEAKLEIVGESNDQQLALQDELFDKMTEGEQAQQEKLLRLKEERKAVYADLYTELGTITGQFLASSSRSLEEYFKQILITSLRAIKRVLLLTYAEITAKDLASKGFGGIATAVAKIALIEGLFGAAEVAVNSFERGGVIGGQADDGYRAGWLGGQVPLHGGLVTGRSHALGGVRQGNVEIEKDEYLLLNGPERYVINKHSTNRFRPQLDFLKQNPHIFSPMRKQQASQINAFNGYGTRFATGGVIGAASDPLPAPLGANGLVPFDSRGNEGRDSAAIQEMISQNATLLYRLAENIEATNARIDRIKVLLDPAEAARKGAEKIRAEARQEL